MVVIVQAVSAVLAGGILAYLTASGRRNKSTYSYMLCVFLLLFWHIAEMVVLLAQDSVQETIGMKVKFLPIVYVGPSWLYFCLTTLHSRLAENKAFVWVLFTFPAIIYLFIVTNEFHHLFYVDIIFKTRAIRGPIFWVHTVESYLCIFSGTIYLFISLRKKFGRTSRESMWLLMGVALPMIANVLMLTDVVPPIGLDITSQVMLFTTIFFGVAVYQKRFLNLIPVAARHFIENTSVGIIIIDHENLVVGMNESANRLLSDMGLKIYDSADRIVEYLENHRDEADSVSAVVQDLQNLSANPAKASIKANGHMLTLEAMVLKGFRQAATGRMLTVTDRTEEHQLMEEINTKNILLTKANERLTLSNTMLTEANHRLEQFSATVEELAVSRERNRMGREVHDTVGHTLTLLIALAENAKLQLNNDQEEIRDMLDKSIDLSRRALNDIRCCLKGISTETFKSSELADWMNYLVKINETSGLEVEYSISDDLPELDAARVMTIFRICQESITNAIRHGHARKLSIIIKSQAGLLRLYIFNDGKGCREIVRGYGLTGMEERVAKLGGSISFGSDGEKGFNIIAEIPLKETEAYQQEGVEDNGEQSHKGDDRG